MCRAYDASKMFSHPAIWSVILSNSCGLIHNLCFFLHNHFNAGSGKGKKELQSIASQLNKEKKVFLESLHNIKSHSECSSNIRRTVARGECCIDDNTDSTEGVTSASNSSVERTSMQSPKQSLFLTAQQNATVEENDAKDSHFVNFVGKQLCFGNTRSHFCLRCFPTVEDKEEFRSFVEELFKDITPS